MEYRGENKTSRIKKAKPWNFQVLHLEGIMCLNTACCLFYFCISHFKALFLHNNHTLLFLLMWRVRPLSQSIFYAPSIHEVLFISKAWVLCLQEHPHTFLFFCPCSSHHSVANPACILAKRQGARGSQEDAEILKAALFLEQIKDKHKSFRDFDLNLNPFIFLK